MGIRLKQGDDLSIEDFKAILELDLACFGEEIFTNKGMAEKRFLKFKDGVIGAFDNDRLIGFISFFCVIPAVYRRAVTQREFIDDNLMADEIKPLSTETDNYILLFDHVIEKAYQGKGTSRMLVDSARKFLSKKNEEGHNIAKIFSYAISPSGREILSSLGGTVIWEKEQIVLLELNKAIFLRHL